MLHRKRINFVLSIKMVKYLLNERKRQKLEEKLNHAS
jgi:transcriptional regulator of met regulon